MRIYLYPTSYFWDVKAYWKLTSICTYIFIYIYDFQYNQNKAKKTCVCIFIYVVNSSEIEWRLQVECVLLNVSESHWLGRVLPRKSFFQWLFPYHARYIFIIDLNHLADLRPLQHHIYNYTRIDIDLTKWSHKILFWITSDAYMRRKTNHHWFR